VYLTVADNGYFQIVIVVICMDPQRDTPLELRLDSLERRLLIQSQKELLATFCDLQ